LPNNILIKQFAVERPKNMIIEKAYIEVKGDIGAGISHQNFTAELFIDTACLDEKDVPAWLGEVRAKLAAAYSAMSGEDEKWIEVIFDYEIPRTIDAVCNSCERQVN